MRRIAVILSVAVGSDASFVYNGAFEVKKSSRRCGAVEKNMTRQLAVCTLIIVGFLDARSATAAPKCSDIPLRVTLFNDAVVDPSTTPPVTVPGAIRSDGQGEYTTATIKVCSGTNDAVTNLSATQRTFTFAVPAPIAGSIVQSVPSWAPGTYAVSGWINIRNLTYSKQPFATMAGMTFSLSGDRSTYRIGFKGMSPDLPNAPNLHDPENTSGDNIPLPSSPVVVYPNYPLTCGPGSMPTWLVRATSPNYPSTMMSVGTLHKQASNPHGTEVHEGQYSAPFEMLIEATKCFAY